MRLTFSLCLSLVAGTFCLAPTQVPGAPSMPQEIPFHLAGGRNPLILVPVYVEGKGPYEFILDTGAFRCLLSPELSVAIGIQAERPLRAAGAGGSIKLSSAHVTSLSVGGTRQENVDVAITEELSRFGNSIQRNVDGVVGFTFLKDFRLALDYRHNLLRLTPSLAESGLEVPPRSATSIPFRSATSSRALILLPTFVNGSGPFQFVLDTGASRTMLSFALARKLGIVAVGDRPGTGGGGQVRLLSSFVDSLSVGKASVRDLPVGVGEFLGFLSSTAETKLDGIIGCDFLSRFDVAIDYPRGEVDLNPMAPH
jgi:predicted aspartyl protease